MPDLWPEEVEFDLYNSNEFTTVWDDTAVVAVELSSIIDPRIISVGEIYPGRGGKGFTTSGERTYTRKFRARVNPDDPDNRKLMDVDIMADARIPKPYAYYVSTYPGHVQSDRLALCVAISAEREHPDDWQTWIVTVEYSTTMPENGPNFAWGFGNDRNGPQNQPELEKPVVRWDKVKKTVARPFDRNGRPYLNAAKQPLTPAPVRTITYTVLLITRNLLVWNPTLAVKYNDVLNDTTCLGAPSGFVYCEVNGVEEKYRGPLRYFRVTFKLTIADYTVLTLMFDPVTDEGFYLEGHQPSYLNAGFYQLAEASTPEIGPPLGPRPVPIYRDGIRVTSSPALLDNNGHAMAIGSDPFYLNFADFRSEDLDPIVEGVDIP